MVIFNTASIHIPNLRAYINFTVTAVNIVGDGESTSIVYDPVSTHENIVLDKPYRLLYPLTLRVYHGGNGKCSVYHKPTCCYDKAEVILLTMVHHFITYIARYKCV